MSVLLKRLLSIERGFGGVLNPLNYTTAGYYEGAKTCAICKKRHAGRNIVHCGNGAFPGSPERREWFECTTCNGWEEHRANGILLGDLSPGESIRIDLSFAPEDE